MRINKPFCCLLLVLSLGTAGVAAASPETLGWSEDNALSLTLELIAVPDNDLHRAQIKLTVANITTYPIVLDKELVVGFSLRLMPELSDMATTEDLQNVAPKKTDEVIVKPATEAGRQRFAPLAPGQSWSRIYDLQKPMKTVFEGHMSNKNMIHYGFFSEQMSRYEIPPKARKLFAEVHYERGVWMMAKPQFKDWFGVSVEEIKLWQGRAVSNTLVIEQK
ncbi:MAG: hypothetical protein NTX50_31090 [Candidatus Sumerlaeota bacterium]|nr:hypothetical protein [Candidatus Sumerlaeota bacterium]